MKRRRLGNYLRTHRKKWGLSQRELAGLLGRTKQTISKYELAQISIPGHLLVAAELIFGVPGVELFPAFCEVIEDSIGARVLTLHQKLANRADARSKKVMKLLSGLPSRLRFSKGL